ncbi:MAG: TonB-dependent receptor [Bacteroidetes bacterium]|nr:TonB-dependent receptor [Bacteroidota bacterium]
MINIFCRSRSFCVQSIFPKTAFLIGLAFLPTSLYGQIPPAALDGFITDSSNGETLIAANIFLEGTLRGATSNLSGYYAVSGIEPGTYIVRFSSIGYTSVRREITFSPGESVRLDIELSPEQELLDAVEVSADRITEEEIRSVGVNQISVATIQQLPQVFEPDVFRSLQLLPGVAQSSDYSSGLYIRGGDPGQTLILLDRTKIYNPSHVFGFFSTFNTDAIKDVRLYKGGFPAKYGGVLGSILDVQNKDGNRRETHGKLSIGLLASRAFAEGPYSRGSWMVALRRSTLEPILAALQDIDAVPKAFYFYDFNGKINFDASPNDKLSVSLYSGMDYLRSNFLDGIEIKLLYGNRTVTGNWTHLWSNQFFTNATVTYTWYESTPTATISGTNFKQVNRVTETSVRADFEYYPNPRHEIIGGFWTGIFNAPLTNFFDDREVFNTRNRVEHATLYFQDTYRPTPNWSIIPGLRATYYGFGSYLTVAPRISIERQLGPDIRLQASGGRYFQFLTLISNETFSGFDFWLTSGEGVKPAYGDQFILGLKTNLMRDITLDAEVYYRTMRQLFIQDPFTTGLAGIEYADLFAFGKGMARGAEIQISRQSGRINGFMAYTVAHTNRFFPRLNQDAFGVPQSFIPRNDRLHDLNVVAQWRISRRWELGAVFTYATGQAYTRPEATYTAYDLQLINGSDETNLLVSPGLNQARLPSYHRLDFGATWSGSFGRFADYELQIQVINAYARENIWFIFNEFEEDGTLSRNTIPQIPVPLPNFSFTLNF